MDLAALELTSGEARLITVVVNLDPFRSGGQQYQPKPASTEARLSVTRTISGWTLDLAFEANVSAPCARCLGEAHIEVDVDAHEIAQPGSGEELSSPYLSDQVLDLDRWAHDSLILEMPAKLLCRADCKGICAICGANLNESDPSDHAHASKGDPRWEKLRHLRLN